MNCKFCDTPGVAHTDPPLCPMHFDLVVLVEYLEGKGQSLTVETVAITLRAAKANGGAWVLTEEKVIEILPAFLEERQGRPEAQGVPS